MPQKAERKNCIRADDRELIKKAAELYWPIEAMGDPSHALIRDQTEKERRRFYKAMVSELNKDKKWRKYRRRVPCSTLNSARDTRGRACKPCRILSVDGRLDCPKHGGEHPRPGDLGTAWLRQLIEDARTERLQKLYRTREVSQRYGSKTVPGYLHRAIKQAEAAMANGGASVDFEPAVYCAPRKRYAAIGEPRK